MRTFRLSPLFTVALSGLILVAAADAFGQARGNAQSLIREADAAMKAEDYRAAERLYRAASAADPQSPEASCGLGQVYLALQQYEDAVQALERCKRDILTSLRDLQAQQARAWGEIDQEIREIEESLQAIRSGRVRSAGPDRVLRLEERIRELRDIRNRDAVQVEVPARVSFALGTAYLNAGLPEKAEWELIDVLRADPGSGDAHNNLAAVYLALGRFEEAATHVRLAEEAGVRVSPQMKADIAAKYSPGAASASRKEPGPSAAPGEAVKLEHQARTCAVKGRFVHVKATVTPSWGVHDPILRFRTGEDEGWYSTYMLPAGQNDFASILPKARSAEAFTYTIEVTTYDDKTTRTPEYQVAIVSDETRCAENAEDSDEVGAVLIIDKPKQASSNDPPVPEGFSIRGTTADVGVLEVGSNTALLLGGAVAAGAVAAGVVVANQAGGAYSGPQPFSEAPGISLLDLDPPSGSTLSLSGGLITVQLKLYAIEDMPGAQVVVELTSVNAPCIRLTAIHDLPARQSVNVVLSGPTVPAGGGFCDTRVPLDEMWVRVTNSNGLGGFRTGLSPLNHIPINYNLTD